MASSISVTAIWRWSGSTAPTLAFSQGWQCSCLMPHHAPLRTGITSRPIGKLRLEGTFLVQVDRLPRRQILRFMCQHGPLAKDVEPRPPEVKIPRSRTNEVGKATRLFAVVEGVVIFVAGASCAASLLRTNQQTSTVSSSRASPHFYSRFDHLPSWHVPALWAALVINAVMRIIHLRLSSSTSESKWAESSIKDFTVDQRINRLEEEMLGVSDVASKLSRHLEKLGVRFRLTRRTLRDPIQETATLSMKTSEVVSALASREDNLEAELRETKRELRETQRLLASLQESQRKQFDLLLSVVKNNLKATRGKSEKSLSSTSRTARSLDSKKEWIKRQGTTSSSSLEIRGDEVKREASALISSQTKKKEPHEGKKRNVEVSQNGGLKAKLSAIEPEKASRYKPDTSFTKEDFWANAPTTSAADISVEHDVVDYLSELERTSSAGSSFSENPPPGSKLDGFFNGRKSINSLQALSTQDYQNSAYNTSGDYNTSGRHVEQMGFGFSFDSAKDPFLKERGPSVDASEVASGGTPVSDTGWSVFNSGEASSSSVPRVGTWSSGGFVDSYAGSGGLPGIGEGIISFSQCGFVDSDFMRDFRDGYVSS